MFYSEIFKATIVKFLYNCEVKEELVEVSKFLFLFDVQFVLARGHPLEYKLSLNENLINAVPDEDILAILTLRLLN